MIDIRRTKSLVPDRGEVLLFVHFEIREMQNRGYGALPAVLAKTSKLRWKLVFVEVSAYSSHLQVTVGLSLLPSTTETAATGVMRALVRSIEIACEPCRIEAIQGVLAPDLSTLRSLVSSHQN